jgi:hypothetical protein
MENIGKHGKNIGNRRKIMEHPPKMKMFQVKTKEDHQTKTRNIS